MQGEIVVRKSKPNFINLVHFVESVTFLENKTLIGCQPKLTG